MMDMPPAFSWSHLDQVAFSWWTTILILLAGALYLLGVARYQRAAGAPWSRKRTASFLGALVVILVATESVVAVYDMTLFTSHMVQHLLLIMVAAALIAMSAPLELALATIPGAPGRWLNEAAGSKFGEILGHPITGLLLYAIFIPATHLTSLFNLMLTHMWVHHLEQFGFLVVGYLFWRPVVAIEPTRHPLQPGLRLVYLALAVPIDTFTGLALAMSGHEMFHAYTTQTRTWGGSLIGDLHAGGAVMWIGGDFLMLLAMIPVAVEWMRDEERKAIEIDAQLDAERAAAERAAHSPAL
jgi:cytochrome c oxidase assembly factor CtaG